MRRSFQEADDGDSERPRVRTWAARAYTDEELSRRFDDLEADSGSLMDETAVKRMVAGERERSSQLMDEETAKRLVRAERESLSRPVDKDAPERPVVGDQHWRGILKSRSRSRSRHREPPPETVEAVKDSGRLWSASASAPVSFNPGDTLPQANVEARAAEASSSSGLHVGCVARLTGLKAVAHLNGQLGKLERFDEASGRWEVRLSDGEAKAIKPENLVAESPEQEEAKSAAAEDLWVPPQSPEETPPRIARADAAPRTPPQAAPATVGAAAARPPAVAPVAMPRSGAGEVAGLSSAALAGVHATRSSSSSHQQHKTARRLGTVRWYNGRRKLGYIIPDSGGSDLFIPAQGAVNGSLVPPQPGGLFHGTRVSYLPMALARPDSGQGQGGSGTKGADVVCMDVRALAGQVGLSCGVESTAGAKETNDDRVAAQDLNELGFLAGVFDGHRGHVCADHVAKHLPAAVLVAYQARAKREGSLVKLSTSQEAALVAGAFVDAFEAVDKTFLVTARKKELKDGSTGVVCLVSHGFEAPVTPASSSLGGCASLWPKPKEPAAPEKLPGTVPRALGGVAKLFVAWCGDCRAVLLRGRQGLRMSEDHRPSRPDEQKRIQRAGGTVVQDGRGIWRVGPRADNKLAKELQKGKKDPSKMKWFLSTSRGFGDSELKAPDPVITATPEVKVVDLVPEDWAVVLGSDGIFDVLSDQEVADTLWRSMAGQGRDPVRAAKDVVQAALRAGSRDNLTAIVMRLGWAPPPSLDGACTLGAAPTQVGEASDSLNIFG